MLSLKIFALVAFLAVMPEAWADSKSIGLDAQSKQAEVFPDVIFNQSAEAKAAMDINPDTYADFWKKWHFVTVRWRQDIRDFRYTFANDLAWKTLTEHRTDYPVGAMFGKLIYPTEEDLALPTSVQPANRLNRLEIILWDPANKKASSDGWVYLRFINRDPRSPQDKDSTGIWGVMSEKEVKSCVECHMRAYDRGFVFSQPAYLFHDSRHDVAVDENKVLSNSFGDSMKEMASADIPRIAIDLIHSIPEWQDRKIKGYEGDFFSGSIGLLSPVLAKLAVQDTKSIFMIYDRDDPNTMALASSVTKKDYKNCSGVIHLRGNAGMSDRPQAYNRDKNKKAQDIVVEEGKKAQGVATIDLTKLYRPSATFYTLCNGDGISRQNLPLLYKVQDKDGLPSYYFAPVKLD